MDVVTRIRTGIDRLRFRRAADQTGESGAAPSGPRLYPPTTKDAIAALTGGIAGIPDGMAPGVLAGVNPVYIVAQRYQKDVGIGTIISLMLPYMVIVLLLWALFVMLWFALGIPLGPGYPVSAG